MEKSIPVHVSAIMDGNGRWAQRQGKERVNGHVEGVRRVRECVEQCIARGVRYFSVYAFSEENWNRPAAEVGFLMQLMHKSIFDEMESLLANGVRFRVLGNMERIAPELREAIAQLESMTASNDRLDLIVFLSYSGRWDILQAARRIALERPQDAASLTMEDFSSSLVPAGIPDPDLIIRTSGEQRISNYLLWQGAYSEFYFTDTLWPDFGREELDRALDSYASRDRRYGKVK